MRDNSCRFVGLATLLFVASCAVETGKTPGASKGDCETAQGVVNTHEIIGKWKKVSSSIDPPKSEAEQDFDFDIFIAEPGNVLCMGEVKNKATVPTAVFTANYEHIVAESILDVQYLTNTRYPALANRREDIRYSFGGSCDKTKLTLAYPDGNVEVFEIFSAEAKQGDCQVGEN